MSNLSIAARAAFNGFISDPGISDKTMKVLKPLIEKMLEKSQH